MGKDDEDDDDDVPNLFNKSQPKVRVLVDLFFCAKFL